MYIYILHTYIYIYMYIYMHTHMFLHSEIESLRQDIMVDFQVVGFHRDSKSPQDPEAVIFFFGTRSRRGNFQAAGCLSPTLACRGDS